MLGDRTDPARRELLNAFKDAMPPCANLRGVDWVTFQPGHQQNDDHMIADGPWDFMGQRWALLAVCDGYGGSDTSGFLADALPSRIRPALEQVIFRHCGGLVDRTNCERASPEIIAMLKRQVVDLDNSLLGAAIRACPNPRHINNKRDAEKIIREHQSTGILARAAQGSTLAMALIAIDDQFMWVAGVGNSTIALSTADRGGKRRAERLCARHTLNDPQENQRVLAARPLPRDVVLDETHPLLRWNPVTRVIGHSPLKMEEASYLVHLFSYVRIRSDVQLSDLVGKIRIPSYLTAEPEAHFVDLKPVWDKDPILLLFTEGVDYLVDNSTVFTPGTSRGVDTLDVIPALLSHTPDPKVEAILGHKMHPKWSGEEHNRAFDILGNLLGGADTERLRKVLTYPRMEAERHRFKIRDTSLIVARFWEMG